MIGSWTRPRRGRKRVAGEGPRPSSHYVDASGATRCGLYLIVGELGETLPEPPASGKTCESCLRLVARDQA